MAAHDKRVQFISGFSGSAGKNTKNTDLFVFMLTCFFISGSSPGYNFKIAELLIMY